jgi:hypothetical protein
MKLKLAERKFADARDECVLFACANQLRLISKTLWKTPLDHVTNIKQDLHKTTTQPKHIVSES